MPDSCPNCGTAIAADAIFCHRCGRNFTIEVPTVKLAEAGETADTLMRLRSALGDRYAISRELGRGGMATVFLATDLKHEREVAIKVLHPELSASLGAERFEREIRLAAKLQHPNILGLYDSGSAAELLYYVMPFVKGESLRDRIDREKMLPVDDAIGIALQLCDALGYAHAQGVVHRDIKPENILLSGGHALVADFGIARAVSEGNARKLTQTGMSMGTPYYMAPEQASGEVVGPPADVYSLGCVLYEMLAGEPPFTGQNSMQIMARHAMEQVPSIRIVRSAVPEEVEEAIFAALGKVPADRPQTATQLAEIMGLPLGSTASMRAITMTPTAQRRIPSAPRGVPVIPRPIAWWRRPPALLGAAVLVVAAAFGIWRAKSGGSRRTIDAGAAGHRIAVLYFEDLSKDHSLGPLADGLTEALIRSLSGASSYAVISSAGAGRFRGSSMRADSIARQLRVGYLVRGQVEQRGDQISVGVHLDDASGVQLQSTSVSHAAGNLLPIRDTLSLVVADLIKQQLGEQFRVQQQRATASNSDAWLLVQRAALARKDMEQAVAARDTAATERSYRSADSLLAAAGALDAKWPDPETQRASLAYRRSRLAASDPAMVRKWVTEGLAHATSALKIDPENADALEMRGTLEYFSWLSNLENDPANKAALIGAAKTDLEKSTSINRNQAGAWSTLSHLYYNFPTSTSTDVLLAAQRAYEADEFLTGAELVLNRLVLASYDLGQFDKAGQWCGEFGRRFPRDYRSVRCQLLLLTGKNAAPDVNRAWKLADSVTALAPAPQRQLWRLNSDVLVAAVIARASKATPALADSARHVLKRSEGDASVDPTRDNALYGAIAYTILGDKADAVRLLKINFAVNPQKIPAYRDEAGWQFRDLANDPGFKLLVGSAR
jgi:eukaryotic-like serine/threonine-protein kinase